MMGNVQEWTESPYSSGDYLSGSYRGIWGGCYYDLADFGPSSSFRYDGGVPVDEYATIGFRVASAIPEPCTLLLLGLGGLLMRKRKKA